MYHYIMIIHDFEKTLIKSEYEKSRSQFIDEHCIWHCAHSCGISHLANYPTGRHRRMHGSCGKWGTKGYGLLWYPHPDLSTKHPATPAKPSHQQPLGRAHCHNIDSGKKDFASCNYRWAVTWLCLSQLLCLKLLFFYKKTKSPTLPTLTWNLKRTFKSWSVKTSTGQGPDRISCSSNAKLLVREDRTLWQFRWGLFLQGRAWPSSGTAWQDDAILEPLKRVDLSFMLEDLWGSSQNHLTATISIIYTKKKT